MTHCNNIAAARAHARLPGRIAATAGAFLLAFCGGASAQPTPGEVVTEAHGDWLTRCFATEVTPRCALTQYVVAEDRPGTELRVVVWRGIPEGQALQVITPLGVALRQGVSLWVDPDAVGGSAEAARVGTIEYQTCGADGCVAQVVLDAATLALLRTGSTAVFVFYLNAAEDEAIGIPISLTGFGEGFDAILE
ncbi:MAG: invasion associated locus B family protein [Bauldia sp.]|nr:invasion associated locus B family protein [Bauldia sp.]